MEKSVNIYTTHNCSVKTHHSHTLVPSKLGILLLICINTIQFYWFVFKILDLEVKVIAAKLEIRLSYNYNSEPLICDGVT